MKRKSRTKFSLLGILRVAPMSGYEIRQRIEQYLAFFWQESWGQIYPSLKKLYEEGLIRPLAPEEIEELRPDLNEESKRERVIYCITPSGEKILDEWMAENPAEDIMRNELLFKFFVAQEKHMCALASMVANEKVKQLKTQAVFEEIDTLMEEGCQDPFRTKVWKYTLKYGELYSQAVTQWCDFVLEDMKKSDD